MKKQETLEQRIERKFVGKQRVIAVAKGIEKADLVLKNATFVNVFSNELQRGDIAVAKGLIVGIGEYLGEREIDASGKIVSPGFIDAHIHLESSLASPLGIFKGSFASRYHHRNLRPTRNCKCNGN